MNKLLFSLLAVFVLLPSSVFAYESVPNPASKGFSDLLIFDTVPGSDFFVLYYNQTAGYNMTGGCDVASSPCFLLSEIGELYRYNESTEEFTLESQGLTFDNEIPSDTSSFQTTKPVLVNGGMFVDFPMQTGFRFQMMSNVFESFISAITSQSMIIIGIVIALIAGNYILRMLPRILNGDPVIERARAVRGHTDAYFRAKNRH